MSTNHNSPPPDKVAKGDKDNKLTLNIIYNGMIKPVEVNANQSIQAVLAHALISFGSPGGEHALFTEAGVELSGEQKPRDVGLTEGARLVLRPRVVRGG